MVDTSINVNATWQNCGMPTKLLPMANPDGTACCVPLTGDVIATEDAQQLAQRFKALGDPHRLQILTLLSQKQYVKKLSVSGIAAKLGISQPNVSHHIRVLKTSGLVRCTKRDGCSYYVVSADRLAELVSMLPRTGGEQPTSADRA